MKIALPDGREVDFSLLKILWIPALALVLAAGLTMVYQVDSQEKGVVLRFGSYHQTVEPGLRFKLPYPIDQVIMVSTETRFIERFGIRSDADTRGGRRPGYDEAPMLTGDLNIILAGWDVIYRVSDPRSHIFNVRDPVETLRDISQSVMREIMGDRATIPILTVERQFIQEQARALIQEQAQQFGMGMTIIQVNLDFVGAPTAVVDSFNDLNRATQDADRFVEEAAREYEERVPRARGQAERMVLEAEGFAERRVNVARGEAQRFTDILRAYREAPEITRSRLYLETMERVLPKLPEVRVVDEDLPSVLPFLNLAP